MQFVKTVLEKTVIFVYVKRRDIKNVILLCSEYKQYI